MRYIQDYKAQIERCIELVQASPDIRKNDKSTIQRAYVFLRTHGYSDPRTRSYLWTMKKISEMGLENSLLRLDKKDVEQLALNLLDRDVAHDTFREYGKALVLLSKIGNKRIPPLELGGAKLRLPDFMTPEQTYSAIGQLRGEARLCSLLHWDSGARPSEVYNLTKADILYDSYGARARLDGKTGERIIRLTDSPAALRDFTKNQAPDAYIFNISYSDFRAELRAIESPLDRPLHHYIFRHSRATHLANFLREAQMCAHFGWTPGSKMPRIYVHLAGVDTESAMLQIPHASPRFLMPTLPAMGIFPLSSTPIPTRQTALFSNFQK